jgi:hypothetical protein
MPTNNYQVIWDETNKKWTCKEDGAAVYDLVENSTVETETFNLISVGAAPAANQTKLVYHTNNWLYINQAAAGWGILQPLTTKGRLIAHGNVRYSIAVGANGYQLEADSAQPYGMKWAAKSSSPLTTKGDIYTYAAADARLPIAGDYRFLVANSGQSTGLEWINPPYCELYRSGSFVAASVTSYNVTWNGTTSDAWNMHPGSSIYITAPIEGLYWVEFDYDITQGYGNVRCRIIPSVNTQHISEWGREQISIVSSIMILVPMKQFVHPLRGPESAVGGLDHITRREDAEVHHHI